jgi:hypothetical protein
MRNRRGCQCGKRGAGGEPSGACRADLACARLQRTLPTRAGSEGHHPCWRNQGALLCFLDSTGITAAGEGAWCSLQARAFRPGQGCKLPLSIAAQSLEVRAVEGTGSPGGRCTQAALSGWSRSQPRSPSARSQRTGLTAREPATQPSRLRAKPWAPHPPTRWPRQHRTGKPTRRPGAQQEPARHTTPGPSPLAQRGAATTSRSACKAKMQCVTPSGERLKAHTSNPHTASSRPKPPPLAASPHSATRVPPLSTPEMRVLHEAPKGQGRAQPQLGLRNKA